MFKSVYPVVVLVLWSQCAMVRAESATVVTDAALYRSPTVQGVQLKQLASGTVVDYVKQVGSWKQINLKQEKMTGWVRSYQVRTGEISVKTESSNSGGFFGALASLSRKASGLFSSDRKEYSYQRTATIGVRGLSEEQIRNAQPDFGELAKLESFRENNKAIRQFAASGQLQSRNIKHLPKSKQEE